MHRREFLLSATGIVGATTVGSMAYTSASVERSVTSSISEDVAGIIGLTAGGTSAVSSTNGKLEVDTSTTDADGLNIDSEFQYGDDTDVINSPAFTITNNDSQAHDITVGLTDDDSNPSSDLTTPGDSDFLIDLYDDTSGSIGTVNATSNLTYNFTSGESVYAIIRIVTDNTSDGQSISGLMTFDGE